MKRKRGAQYPRNNVERVPGWHIIRKRRSDFVLGNQDNRVIKPNKWYRMKTSNYIAGKHPVLCRQGMHACRRMVDCLHYNFGLHPDHFELCRVDVAGFIKEDNNGVFGDKFVGKYRRINHSVCSGSVIVEAANAVIKARLLGRKAVLFKDKEKTRAHRWLRDRLCEKRHMNYIVNAVNTVMTKIVWLHIRRAS